MKRKSTPVLGILLYLFTAPCVAFFSFQQALEDYAKGLTYLDDKVFVYQIDLSGNGYDDLLLTTSNGVYANLNRFGLKAFKVYPRLATSTENYLASKHLPLYVDDELGTLGADKQLYIKSYGTPHKDSPTPTYYYWMDEKFTLHSNYQTGEVDKVFTPLAVNEVNSFKAKLRLRQVLGNALFVSEILPSHLKATKQNYDDSIRSKVRRSIEKTEVEGRLVSSTKFELEENGDYRYIGNYIRSKRIFYPSSEDEAEVLFNVLLQLKGGLKQRDDGTTYWKYYFKLAPEWAEQYPEAAARLKKLQESCLPHEICQPVNN